MRTFPEASAPAESNFVIRWQKKKKKNNCSALFLRNGGEIISSWKPPDGQQHHGQRSVRAHFPLSFGGLATGSEAHVACCWRGKGPRACAEPAGSPAPVRRRGRARTAGNQNSGAHHNPIGAPLATRTLASTARPRDRAAVSCLWAHTHTHLLASGPSAAKSPRARRRGPYVTPSRGDCGWLAGRLLRGS